MGHYINLARAAVDVLGAEKPFDMRWFVRWLIDNDHPRFCSSSSGIRAAVRIEKALDSLKYDDDWLFIEQDTDHALLKQSAEGPVVMTPGGLQGTYPLTKSRKLLGLIDDIVNAPEKKPAKR